MAGSVCLMAGSSPLARGLPDRGKSRGNVSGIIPARAGFTATLPSAATKSTDHPRSRGVYWLVTPDEGARLGSSPLARGLQLIACNGVGALRIIPARAGFTETSPEREPRPPDHPRSRGVYKITFSHLSASGGSSPLARGLQRPLTARRIVPRIIPARAGFTRLHSPRMPAYTDHPRSRGGY